MQSEISVVGTIRAHTRSPRKTDFVFREREGYARVKISRDGLARIDYGGLMTSSAFCAIRDHVIEATRNAIVGVGDMRRLVFLGGSCQPLITREQYVRHDAQPACFVVNPPQFRLWADYAVAVAEFGVCRAVFLSEEQALSWARIWLPRPRSCR